MASTINTPAEKINYTFVRENNKPASESTLKNTSQSLENTGLVSLETDGVGNTIDWLDQIWVNQDYSQAMFLKFDLKPQDESLLGKTVKMEKGFLMHGRQDSGTYFAAYFYGFDEKSANTYFQKVAQSKNKSAFNALKSISLIPSAHAEQKTNSCGTNVIGVAKGLYTVVKEYRWTCLKAFVKQAFGGILGTVANTALSVMDGSIWSKVGSNWDYVLSVIGVVQKTTKSFKDLEFLPEKTRAEFVCETMGKGFNATVGKNIKDAVTAFIKQTANELYHSVKYRKIIEENKLKQTAFCTKVSGSNKKNPISNYLPNQSSPSSTTTHDANKAR